jgi:hypothetical protein
MMEAYATLMYSKPGIRSRNELATFLAQPSLEMTRVERSRYRDLPEEIRQVIRQKWNCASSVGGRVVETWKGNRDMIDEDPAAAVGQSACALLSLHWLMNPVVQTYSREPELARLIRAGRGFRLPAE